MSYYLKIDETVNRWEDHLTNLAKYSFVAPGIAKVGLGALQVTAAVTVIFFCCLPAIFSEIARENCRSSLSHMAHGFANIVCGSLQSIPLVSTLTHYALTINPNQWNQQKWIATAPHQRKWIPYDKIQNRDVNVWYLGENPEQVQKPTDMDSGYHIWSRDDHYTRLIKDDQGRPIYSTYSQSKRALEVMLKTENRLNVSVL